jgi:hypothetical protein
MGKANGCSLLRTLVSGRVGGIDGMLSVQSVRPAVEVSMAGSFWEELAIAKSFSGEKYPL